MSKIIKLHDELWNRIKKTTEVDKQITDGYLRVFVLFYIAYYFCNEIGHYQLPDGLFNPPRLSLAVFFDSFPSLWFVNGAHLSILICLVMIAVNVFRKFMTLLCFTLLIIIFNFKYSLGKVDHPILLLMIFLCYGLTNWNSDKAKGTFLLPIKAETLYAILIAFGMLTAGLPKAANWIDFDISKSGFLGWYYRACFNVSDSLYFLAPYVLKIPQIVIELFDYLAVLFELSPIFLLFSGKRKWWVIWCLVACVFHLSTTLLLNISFSSHFLVYLPFILPLGLAKRINNLSKAKYFIVVICFSVIQAVLFLLKGTSLFDLYLSDKWGYLLFNLCVWLALIVLAIYTLYIEFKSSTANKESLV